MFDRASVEELAAVADRLQLEPHEGTVALAFKALDVIVAKISEAVGGVASSGSFSDAIENRGKV